MSASLFSSIKEVEKVSNKQKAVTTATHDLIDKLSGDVGEALRGLSDPSTSESDVR